VGERWERFRSGILSWVFLERRKLGERGSVRVDFRVFEKEESPAERRNAAALNRG